MTTVVPVPANPCTTPVTFLLAYCLRCFGASLGIRSSTVHRNVSGTGLVAHWFFLELFMIAAKTQSMAAAVYPVALDAAAA